MYDDVSGPAAGAGDNPFAAPGDVQDNPFAVPADSAGAEFNPVSFTC